MIKFLCKNCGQKLNVEDKYSGKQVRCPKCGSISVIPAISDKITFHCKTCGQKINVFKIHAGKKGKCPKCQNIVVVPESEAISATTSRPGTFLPPQKQPSQYPKESEETEESEGMNVRLILKISGAAIVGVFAIIVLAIMLRPSGKKSGVLLSQQEVVGNASQPQLVPSNLSRNEIASSEDKLNKQTVPAQTLQTVLPDNGTGENIDIYNNTRMSGRAAADTNISDQNSQTTQEIFDDFNGIISPNWTILHADQSHYSLTKKPGYLTIITQKGDFYQAYTDFKNLFVINNSVVGEKDFDVTTCMAGFIPTADYQQAGIVLFNDQDNYIKWTYEWNSSRNQQVFALIHEIQGSVAPHTYVFDIPKSEKVWLRLSKQGNTYSYLTSTDGKSFRVNGKFIWEGSLPKSIGLVATNSYQSAPEIDAAFDFFEVETKLTPTQLAKSDTSLSTDRGSVNQPTATNRNSQPQTVPSDTQSQGTIVQETYQPDISINSPSPSATKIAAVVYVIIFIFLILICILQIVSMWIVFQKADEPGWAIFIPIYNSWILAKVGEKPGWMGLIMLFSSLIPIVGIFISLILHLIISIGIARNFDRGVLFGIGLCFLPIIFYPILAFTD
jgi:DNA-directed RNA polymerase subunit RPC12/RpoP